MASNESTIDVWFKGKNQVSESRVFNDIQKLLRLWQPESDIRALNYGFVLPVMLSGFPGVAVATTILRANRFSLWGPGKLFLSMTACGMPALTNYFTYDALVKKDILLGITPCSVCLETRAVSLQMLTGVIMPACIV